MFVITIDVIIYWLIVTLLILLLIVRNYLEYRYDKVSEFRDMITELGIQYLERKPDRGAFSIVEFIDKHTFKQMLFSIKPLKLKYWYAKEELENIYN